jgi:hypothetical protein
MWKLEVRSWKVKGERMEYFASSFELRADLALADGLMLVFQHPVQGVSG